MAKIERTYTIPLRREWLKSPKHRRSKKAAKAVREFLAKHMKVELSEVKIGKNLNEDLWKHGIKNPPCRIKVNVVKEDSGIVFAELIGHKIEEMIAKEDKGKKKEKVKKPEAPKEEKAKEEKAPEKKEEPKPEAKPAETKVSEHAQKAKLSDKPEGMPTAVNVKKVEPKKEEAKPAEPKAEEKK